MFGSLAFGLQHTEEDLERASKIAAKRWNQVEEEKRNLIPEYIPLLFEQWKFDQGEVAVKTESSGTLASLFNPTLATGEERLSLLRERAPWECLPMWKRQSPIDLLIHIWISDYKPAMNHIFYESLAWLIIDCCEKKDPNWAVPIISAALMLADLHIHISDKTKEGYLEALKEIWPKAKSHDKQFQGIVEQQEKRKLDAQSKRSKTIYLASGLLEKGKNPRNIVSIITRETNGNKRTIRRNLEEHPSGYWKPKKKVTHNRESLS